MKNLVLKSTLAVSFIALMFTFTSCDVLDNADDVTFTTDFTLPEPFVIDVQGELNNPYENKDSIKVDQNPEVQDYKDRIKEIVVNEVNYTISDFEGGDVTLESGTVTFSAVGQGGSRVIAEIHDLPLANGSGQLEINNDDLETISNLLLEDGEVVVVSSATLSDAPVKFSVTVSLNVTVTANALK